MRPFLKWLGGKTRLLPQLEPLFPEKFSKYVEPFVGGGAVFLHVAQHWKIKSAVLCDVSEELTMAWKAVQEDPYRVCSALKTLVEAYLSQPESSRSQFYYLMRERHNQRQGDLFVQSARVIFLNKTCYNGLFRHNLKGGFNAPFGRYPKPSFYDPENIEAISRLLGNVTILQGDFTACEKMVTKSTFVYFDPPYRPLNATSSFTSFASKGFDDADQERLAASFKRLHKKGAKLMLSNSDTPDGYFERLYSGFNIHRVTAGRAINSNPERRGKISELVITNY